MHDTARFDDRDPRSASPGGFALPATLMGLALLALLAATGSLVSWLEVRSSAAFGAGTAAFYVADGGLATALASAAPSPPGSMTVAVGPGTADVRLEPLLDLDVGERLYRVVSEGSVVWRGATLARGVSQVVWIGQPPRMVAALLVSDTLRTASTTGTISGFDAGGCGGAPVAGVAGWRRVAPGAGVLLSGSPPLDSIAPGVTTTALTGLRWADLALPGAPVPDAVVPPDPWPAGPAYIRLSGGGALGPAETGSGALVATGDLTLAHGFRWTGLVLVGGSLTVTGAVAIRGAVATGLDPGRTGIDDLGPGPVDLAFDACAVASAAARLTPFPAAIPGTWRERW